MKYLLSLFFVLSCLLSIAQPPGGGGQPKGNFAPAANNGHFFGKIVDAKTNKGLNGATVLLTTSKKDSSGQIRDVPVTTTLTAPNGDFSLEQLPVRGNFTFRASNIGYGDYTEKVSFTPG